MIDIEGMILSIQEYIESPKFLSMSEEQKTNFVRHGIPMLIGTLVGAEILGYAIKSCELERLDREIDMAKLERLWETKK